MTPQIEKECLKLLIISYYNNLMLHVEKSSDKSCQGMQRSHNEGCRLSEKFTDSLLFVRIFVCNLFLIFMYATFTHTSRQVIGDTIYEEKLTLIMLNYFQKFTNCLGNNLTPREKILTICLAYKDNISKVKHVDKKQNFREFSLSLYIVASVKIIKFQLKTC